MLSTTKYSSLCLLGMEVFYILCLGYGLVISPKARALHHSLFELLPGFVWGEPVSMVWGGLLLGVFALVAGWYIAWMHNASLLTTKD